MVAPTVPAPTSIIRRVDAWILEPAPPERLAVFRILVGAYATVAMTISVGEFARLNGRSSAQFEPVGVAGLLTGPLHPAALWLLFLVAVLSGAAFTVGARFRTAGPVFALAQLTWASYHASWGQMLHFEHLVTLHVLVLGFSPAAHSLSLDARRPEARGPTSRLRLRQTMRQTVRSIDGGATRPGPHTRYGWPLRLAAIITAVSYVLAGVAKLRLAGLQWVDADTLANHIAYSATRMDLLGEPRPPLATTIIGNRWLVQPMALGSMAVELLAPLALLGGWYRRVWVPSAILFHLGTLTMMFVFFSFNGLGFALLPLYRIERLIPRRIRPVD